MCVRITRGSDNCVRNDAEHGAQFFSGAAPDQDTSIRVANAAQATDVVCEGPGQVAGGIQRFSEEKNWCITASATGEFWS
jgi:hypothetical protein